MFTRMNVAPRKPALLVRSQGERFRFLPDGNLLLLHGEPRSQQFWRFEWSTGRIRRLTNLRGGYAMRTFDVSPDGKQILFERTKENSDTVFIEWAGT